ncbi:hypothetical protein P343_14855 [Sporolactobacillus laevolacticus DSM 442]|uniref:Uncharacterized protein n=1 Tax=Sporolactobacillus laevolacticus DSM 442 TaxID=1395513 RepID=V6IV32_9BACL|nr:hypothetical protein P343_14855 [Sporolactobacillus laevolacticus DSM 442]
MNYIGTKVPSFWEHCIPAFMSKDAKVEVTTLLPRLVPSLYKCFFSSLVAQGTEKTRH